MRFASPQIDYAFKKIFGSTQSQPILISFLNAIIYQGNSTIKDLEIINPAQAGSVLELKDSYLDVKAVLDNGEIVIIEMQVLNHTGFAKRIMYNACKAYDNQLLVRGQYDSVKPVIALTITDFQLFPTKKVITKFVFKEAEELFDYPCQITLIFVELSKFVSAIEQLQNLTEIWLYFLKEAENLQDIPETLGQIPAVNLALQIANQANMTVGEWDQLEKQLFYIADQKKVLLQKEQLQAEKDQLASEKEQLAYQNQQLLEQQRNLINRLLTKKLGNLEQAIALQINQLSESQLVSLGEVLLDFQNISDLTNWLQQL